MSVPVGDDDPFASEQSVRSDIHTATTQAVDEVIDDRDREPTELEAEPTFSFESSIST